MTAIRKHLGDFFAIIFLVVIAGGVGGYVLANQRFRFPFIDEKPFQLKASLATAQAVTPGQGQTVRVSGVRIGDLSKVELKDGRAIVTMDIDQQYKKLVHTNATALLRPKTGLKDMFIELDPGTSGAPVAKSNWTIPINNTLPDINPDEIFSALDSDTRDYLKLLINGAGEGLHHRGGDLQEVFRRFEPTHRDLARVTSAVATRSQHLRRVITSLNLLNTELAGRSNDLSQLVESSNTVFQAFASEDRNISRTIHAFPAALRQTTRTLGKVETFANVLGPTADQLRPTVRALNRANQVVRPFVREITPVLRDRIRPFVRDARPLVRSLRPAAADLAKSTPDLTRSFTVFNHLFDMLGYNPNGREDPSNAARQEGYLFYLAWLGHEGLNLFASGDANGTFRPVFLAGNCSVLKSLTDQVPLAGEALNLAPILGNKTLCGG